MRSSCCGAARRRTAGQHVVDHARRDARVHAARHGARMVHRAHRPARPAAVDRALAVPPFITSAGFPRRADRADLRILPARLPAGAALLDPHWRKARTLGCSPSHTFFRVVLPQLRRACGGMLLVALGVLSEFGAFQLLRFRTFTTEIYAEYRTAFDGGGVAARLRADRLLCLAIEGTRSRHARVAARAAPRRDALSARPSARPVTVAFARSRRRRSACRSR